MVDWLDGARSLQAETIALRRAIHSEPELGLQTPRTLAKVQQALAGCAADARGHRSRLRLYGAGRHACLRARCSHGDAGVGGEAAVRPSREPGRAGNVHVSTGRRGLAWRALHDRGVAAYCAVAETFLTEGIVLELPLDSTNVQKQP